MEIIYCANGNARFAEIAIRHGFLYGAQLPGTVYHPIYMADQNWKAPDKAKYMAALAQHRPHMASVLDLEQYDQLEEVLDWAEEAAQFVAVVMIIPKVAGIIELLPRTIAGATVRLGYSIPTRHGGTMVSPSEFHGWPVHLLGGSPHKQMRYSQRIGNVVSVDGNYMNKMATGFNQFWVDGTATYASNRWWPTLREANGGVMVEGKDLPYLAFERSCINIMAAWRRLNCYADLPIFSTCD